MARAHLNRHMMILKSRRLTTKAIWVVFYWLIFHTLWYLLWGRHHLLKKLLRLSEYITTRFPKDTLDIVAFGDEAWNIELEELPLLRSRTVYHTNTQAALEMALDLRKRKNANKQVFMITDGKPTCIKRGNKLYKNSMGLDRMIVNRTLNQASKFKKTRYSNHNIYDCKGPLFDAIQELFTETNGGKAFYSDLQIRRLCFQRLMERPREEIINVKKRLTYRNL